MNSLIEAQIHNMLVMTRAFEQSCRLAAEQDDGVVSPEEAKQLRQIKKAAEKFCGKLESIR